MSGTDEIRAATQEVAALFRDHYMVPNTWPEVRRFLAAVEALEGQNQGTSQSQSSGPGTDSTVAGTGFVVPVTLDAPSGSLPQEKPERRAPQSQS